MSSADPVRSFANPVALNPDQRRLVRHAFESGASVRARSDRGAAASGQRQAIRELCLSCRQLGLSPVELLIAFNAALNETANDAGMAHGPERNELLSRLVTVFIEELHEFRIQRAPRRSEGADSRGT